MPKHKTKNKITQEVLSVKNKKTNPTLEKDKQLILAIEKTANNIRRKFNAIKRNEDSEITSLKQRYYKPIVEPLTDAISKISSDTNENITQQKTLDNVSGVKTEIQKKEIDFTTLLRSPNGYKVLEYYLQEHMGPISRPYIKQLLFNDNSESNKKYIDSQYGVRRDGNSFKIGDSYISFNKDDIINVYGQQYKVTPGLANLLFLTKPLENSYTLADLNTYKNIVVSTNAHKKGYLPFGNIVKNKSYKYKNIIQYFASSGKVTVKGGNNMVPVTRNDTIDFKYWNDPNELVQRLHLLHSSRVAGNTGLRAEIAAIEEELREENLIV